MTTCFSLRYFNSFLLHFCAQSSCQQEEDVSNSFVHLLEQKSEQLVALEQQLYTYKERLRDCEEELEYTRRSVSPALAAPEPHTSLIFPSAPESSSAVHYDDNSSVTSFTSAASSAVQGGFLDLDLLLSELKEEAASVAQVVQPEHRRTISEQEVYEEEYRRVMEQELRGEWEREEQLLTSKLSSLDTQLAHMEATLEQATRRSVRVAHPGALITTMHGSKSQVLVNDDGITTEQSAVARALR